MLRLSIPKLWCVLLFVAGCTGSTQSLAVSSIALGRYGHALHNRFYEAWQQPASVGLPPGKLSIPADVMVDSTGRVLDFRIVKSSGNAQIDSSIAAVGKAVQQVTPPPGFAPNKPFKLRIYFELDVVR